MLSAEEVMGTQNIRTSAGFTAGHLASLLSLRRSLTRVVRFTTTTWLQRRRNFKLPRLADVDTYSFVPVPLPGEGILCRNSRAVSAPPLRSPFPIHFLRMANTTPTRTRIVARSFLQQTLNTGLILVFVQTA